MRLARDSKNSTQNRGDKGLPWPDPWVTGIWVPNMVVVLSERNRLITSIHSGLRLKQSCRILIPVA